MTKIALSALILFAAAVPAVGSAAPLVGDDDPLGSLRWLPKEANERPSGDSLRLVLVFDRSLDPQGNPRPVLARGRFALKLASSTAGQLNIDRHSPHLRPIRGQDTGRPEVDFVLSFLDLFTATWEGDVRDGDCSKVGTAAFSKAYSTTASFFHPGEQPYEAISAPGRCEVVDRSEVMRDGAGRHIGFQTTVTRHVPGVWIDVFYTEWSTATFRPGRANADLWYEALYDADGDGDSWLDADARGSSRSVDPLYDRVLRYTALPGGTSTPCLSLTDPEILGTWMDHHIDVPPGSSSVVFRLFPKGAWLLRVIDPSGEFRSAIPSAGRTQTISAPGSGVTDFPVLRPGRYTMRACNVAGEHEVVGASTIR